MPDGRCLMQSPNWLSAAREFTFWIRAGPYVKLKDAVTHQRWHRIGLNTVHGLALRGFKSLEQLTEDNLEDYFEESVVMGVDGILNVDGRTNALLLPFHTIEDVPEEFLIRKPELKLNAVAVAKACNLPASVVSLKAFHSKLRVHLERLTPRRLSREAEAESDGMEGSVLSAGSLYDFISYFEAQHALRDVMNCPTIRFNPFMEETPAEIAKRLGRAGRKTPIAPHHLMIRLFEGCTKILVNDWDDIRAEYIRAARAYLNSTVSWSAVSQARSKVLHVANACFVLISGFTARRPGEVRLLERDCLAGNNEKGWWLKVTIIKNHDHTKTWVTIPNIVARAVSILIEIADFHADEARTDKLFVIYAPSKKRFVELTVCRGITEFARKLDAVSYVEDGVNKEWLWYPRQFRRFFAVVFFHRFNGGMETLCHELRHWSVDQARGYATLDTEAARYWLKTEQEFKRHVATTIANDEEELTGPLANRYRKLSERLKRMLRGKIVPVDQTAAEMIVRHMGREANVFTVNAWSTCGCPNSQKGTDKANCRKGGKGQGLGASLKDAGTSVCGDCPWSMQNAAQREYVARDAAKTREILENDCRPQNIFKMLQERRYLRLVEFVEDAA
ncbi:hypothetical protein [Rhizobium indicum]|uniref:Site-specific integrase n=1 Tax=Rhizobium indicum TaxID=2583231 RepID=A0ABX6PJJ8_9HYPH|nr:hypothetical protein [Rhizobium indicum]QKK18811.1 hypothetical protein FFM53_021145 [Rhizobium indicum]